MKAPDWLRKVLLVILISLVLTGLYLGPPSWLSLKSLRKNRNFLKDLFHKHPIATPMVYTLFYISMVGVSMPGATALTMSSGILFPQPLAAMCACTVHHCIFFNSFYISFYKNIILYFPQ
jgi:uncharacterized membrane protein YdjX (TVP38/TMEM64 family)